MTQKKTSLSWLANDAPVRRPRKAQVVFEAKGSMPRAKQSLKGVLVQMPTEFKEHFLAHCSGAFSTNILMLAELRLSELEANDEKLVADVERLPGARKE